MSHELFSISDRLREVAGLLRQAQDARYHLAPKDVVCLVDFTQQMANEAKRLENRLSCEIWNGRAAREENARLRAMLPDNVTVLPLRREAEVRS
ncbi:MAG: hypothetical protein ABGX47_08250 [Martelella sp.]|uniref:hypothetical protein n=1 Tax=Martelella sp. TaxID=1969699 RepID=UPI0032425715